MQMNVSTGYKPEAQTTIPSKSIHKKKKIKIKTIIMHLLDKSISQLVHGPLSEQAAFKSRILITVLRMEYHTLHYQTPPL